MRNCARRSAGQGEVEPRFDAGTSETMRACARVSCRLRGIDQFAFVGRVRDMTVPRTQRREHLFSGPAQAGKRGPRSRFSSVRCNAGHRLLNGGEIRGSFVKGVRGPVALAGEEIPSTDRPG